MQLSLATFALAIAAGVNAIECPGGGVQDKALKVVGFTGGDAAAFCASWQAACTAYKPANTSFVFYGTGCLPGNLRAGNKTTEARVTCSFTADGGCTNTGFFDPIAAATGATILPLH